MNLLVIKDDKPGHYNQTEGLVLQLKEIYPNLTIEYIDIKIKSKFRRKLLRFFLNNFTSFFYKKENLKYLSFFYEKYLLPTKTPDLIISTGGNTSNINAWFSKAYNCKNLLNGALRGLKEELFTYVTTVIDLGYKNQIILDVAPSIITKEKLKESSQNFSIQNKLDMNKTYYSLLIGGNGSGYVYDEEFFENLIEFVKNISTKNSITWLITTSRRTPQNIEKKLYKALESYSSYFVSYNQKEEKILLPFLGLSEKIFVTEESASMISEAISSCKPVFTLRPNSFRINTQYKRILDKFILAKKIKTIDIYKSSLEDLSFNFDNKIKNRNLKKLIEDVK